MFFQPVKVAVIDDNIEFGAGVKILLAKEGVEVHTAADGLEGFEMAKHWLPDIVLLDIVMPGMDGIEVCKKIRQTPELTGTYVVMLSGVKIQSDQMAEGIEAGADNYIARPISNRELLARLRAYIRLKRTEKALNDSEERFRILFNNAPLGYQSLDFDGNFIEVNQQWLDTLGYNREEVIGKWFGDFLTPAFKDGFRKRFPVFISQGQIHSEFEMVHKNGSVLFIAFDGRTGYDTKGNFKQTHCILQDITEMKMAEKALLKSNELLNTMEKAAKIGGWEFNVETMVQTWTEETFHILEIDTTHGAPVVPEGIGFIAPEYQPMALVGIQRAIEFGEPYNQEWEVITAKGNKRWVNAIATPYQENGKTKSVSGSFQDITLRKQAEIALVESEENLSITLRSIGDGVISTDKNGLIIQMNPVAETLCGWPFSEAAGKQLAEVFRIINAETRQTVTDPVAKVLEKGEIVGLANHTVLISRNGAEHQIADSAAPIKNKEGSIKGVVLVFSDVTEKYAAQVALKDSEQRFKSLIENAPDGVVIVDEQGKITYGSPNASRHFGYMENEIIGHSGDEFTHPEDLQLVLDALETIMYNPDQKPKVKYRFKRKNGEFRWIETTFINLLSEKAINGIVLNFSDITERKKMLEELVTAKEQAEESDRLKSAFLANMSHEIRTPMNGILGFAELLKEPGLTGEEQQKYIRIIEKSGARMLNIINDIVDISKIEAGLMQLDIKETNINGQIEYIYTFFKPEVEAKGIMFSFSAPLTAKAATITTDREKLYAILTNLVKNAIKYTSKGSIDFGYVKKDAYLEFFVKDTGIGIPGNRQEAIFERFVQADIADTMAYQGVGLGLSITKSYVEMQGGKIWVESEEDFGSTFYFTLPYHAEPMNEDIERQFALPNIAEMVRKLKILIAEDDEVSEMLLDKTVKKFSEEILIVRTGTEAVEVCRRNPNIDLILMDVRMPDMGGYEAARQIREFNNDVVIIAQTAYGLTGDRKKAIEAGCNDYIAKPIQKDELLGLIQRYFGT